MYKALFITTLSIVFLCSCSRDAGQTSAHRGVYHWKTTYNPTDWEKKWMKDHKVNKLYIKLFDVEAGDNADEPDWKMVPVATTVFKQKLPKEMDVIPVVYITVDAIRALDGDYWSCSWYARRVVKRINDMMDEHYEGTIKEVQLDCDWTQQTERTYFMFVREIKSMLDSGITISGTLRLHQLREVNHPTRDRWRVSDSIPFDRSMLMCYNTGRLQDRKTKNSILDFDDVEPYLRQYIPTELPRTDVAYPVYGWGVEFNQQGQFRKIVNSQSLANFVKNQKDWKIKIREEWGEPREIRKTQRALPLLDSLHTVILYHLDSLNLSKYSYEDIEEFYSR